MADPSLLIDDWAEVERRHEKDALDVGRRPQRRSPGTAIAAYPSNNEVYAVRGINLAVRAFHPRSLYVRWAVVRSQRMRSVPFPQKFSHLHPGGTSTFILPCHTSKISPRLLIPYQIRTAISHASCDADTMLIPTLLAGPQPVLFLLPLLHTPTKPFIHTTQYQTKSHAFC